MRFIVTGAIFSEEPSYYKWDNQKKFPRYEMEEERAWGVDTDTLDDAEKWLIENHPEYYMGSTIVSEDKNSFSLQPVPCEEYGKGNYETKKARTEYVRSLAK